MQGQGLTAYKSVGLAIKLYHGFDWLTVRRIVPAEWETYGRAVAQVNGNQYFGFSRDLGHAKSTGFRTLFFIATELHRVIGGVQTFRDSLPSANVRKFKH
jgi:hypothetical protein